MVQEKWEGVYFFVEVKDTLHLICQGCLGTSLVVQG